MFFNPKRYTVEYGGRSCMLSRHLGKRLINDLRVRRAIGITGIYARQITEEEPIVSPGANQPVRFDPHIKSLFREKDRRSMQFAFDLWSYDDVAKHANAILARVRAGSMPCDGAWPPEHVALFQRWIDSGKPA